MPRHKYVPTEKDRAVVYAMASFGIPQEDIGRVVGCSHVTLRRAYAKELETAGIEANAKVAEILFRCAVDPDPRHNNARFFWMKTRAGWRETSNISMVKTDGTDAQPVLDLASVTEWLRQQPGPE